MNVNLALMKYTFLYIDPSSGSYIVQMFIAGILGSLFFFKNAWIKFKNFITGKKTLPQEEDENAEQ